MHKLEKDILTLAIILSMKYFTNNENRISNTIMCLAVSYIYIYLVANCSDHISLLRTTSWLLKKQDEKRKKNNNNKTRVYEMKFATSVQHNTVTRLIVLYLC